MEVNIAWLPMILENTMKHLMKTKRNAKPKS